jgi:protein SCO1/2
MFASRCRGRWRRAIGISACLALAAGVAGGAVHAASSPTSSLTGIALRRDRAPDFLLRDSSGQAYSLSRFRGHVVVLVFLYTQCPETCPFTAELLRKADAAAGHPDDLDYVAVSVDPWHDTAASIATFSQAHHLEELGDRFHYLIGSPTDLARVWQAYAARDPEVAPADLPIEHVASIYFIDRQGRRRLLTRSDVPVPALAENERRLRRQ